MRRSGSSTVRVEGGSVLVGPPKSFLDVKLERTHHGQDLHAADGKPKVLGESAAAGVRDMQVECRC